MTWSRPSARLVYRLRERYRLRSAASTANDFTSPARYTVTAANGTTQSYLVTVTVAAYVPAQIDGSDPDHGLVGSQVTLTGSGFGGSGKALFGRKPITRLFQGPARP